MDQHDNAWTIPRNRHLFGAVWKIVFIVGTFLSVLFLVLLLASIFNSVFGYAALRYSVAPKELVQGKTDTASFTREELTSVFETHMSAGIKRRVLYEQQLSEVSDKKLAALIDEYIVKPEVLKTWSLSDSLFARDEIEKYVKENENAYLSFRSWLSPSFLVSKQSSDPLKAGIRTAILGSLWIMLITLLFAFPIGVGAAIYLQEYAEDNRFTRALQLNIFNLSAVPSIIYGLLGLAVFVRVMEPITSGMVFSAVNGGGSTINGRTILSGGLTLGLLILPIIIINTQEALKAIPDTLRNSSYGVGATKWQTIWHQLLPVSIDRILTGTILALSRALGETAPLVVIGASTFIAVDPSGIFSKFTTLPIQIYQWTARPQGAYRNIAAAAIIALLVLLMLLNGTAIYLRNRVTKKRQLEQ